MDEGVVGTTGVGLLAADESEALVELIPLLISFSVWAGPTWLLISQLNVLAKPLSTPLSSVLCAEETGFFLEDLRLSL